MLPAWSAAIAHAFAAKSVLMFAHTPPPHHGQSYMVQLMLEHDGLKPVGADFTGIALRIPSVDGDTLCAQDIQRGKLKKLDAEQRRVVVTVDKKQTVYVGNHPVNIHRLGSSVLDQMRGEKTSPVYLRCDQAVPFGAFAKVIDALKQAFVIHSGYIKRQREAFAYAFHSEPETTAAERGARAIAEQARAGRATRETAE